MIDNNVSAVYALAKGQRTEHVLLCSQSFVCFEAWLM